MSLELLLEVGCEEIPARYFSSILEQLRQRFSQSLSESNLHFEQIEIFATPRRLINYPLASQTAQKSSRVRPLPCPLKMTKRPLGLLKDLLENII